MTKNFYENYGNISIKSTETRDDLLNTLYLQSEINFCSVRMPVNAIPTSLPQVKLNAFSGKDPANGVFNIMHT